MIIKKIKSLLDAFREGLDENKKAIKEVEWANIYHDSIRDNDDLQKLSLKIGRWAGNYSFFFLLHRILKDFQPPKIVEFGLGESSKFISTYNRSIGNKHEHTVIEQDNNWTNIFNDSFPNDNVTIQHHPLQKKTVKGHEYNGYKNIEEIPNDADFYLIDGPFGSPHFSRYDILYVLEKISLEKEFILILDDYCREGEQETAAEILLMFKEKGKKIYSTKIEGSKSQFILVTEKYKYALSV
jgi:hypothetical protein